MLDACERMSVGAVEICPPAALPCTTGIGATEIWNVPIELCGTEALPVLLALAAPLRPVSAGVASLTDEAELGSTTGVTVMVVCMEAGSTTEGGTAGALPFPLLAWMADSRFPFTGGIVTLIGAMVTVP